MIQLAPPIEFTKKAIGDQAYKRNKKYRFAYFTLISNKIDKFLIYNNLTRELLLLSDIEYRQLENSGYTRPIDLVEELVNKWFLVPENNEDFLLCDQVLNLVDLLNSNKHFTVHNFNILTTTACNARCFYCYQAGTKIKTMNEKTALDVAEYIIKKSRDKSVEICWFGGEPLCNSRAIDIICEHLNRNNKKFYSSLTSNGYLFNKKMIQISKRCWHLKKAQITLDGLSETYLKVKNYRNGDKDAFYKVLDNIEYLLQNEIRVEVRLNMDNYNYDELCRLIDLLSNKFGKYNLFMIYARPIYENVGFQEISHTDNSRADITNKFNQLRDQITLRNVFGETHLMRNYRRRACQADDETWRLILPDGTFAFCEHFLDGDSFGSIYDDAEKPVWSEYCDIEEKCKKCPAYIDCIKNKKCPESSHACYDYEQTLRVDRIFQGIEKEYTKYVKNIKSADK